MSKSNLLRTNYTGRGKWAKLAEIINQIHRLLNNITCDGNDAIVTTEGIRISSINGNASGAFSGIARNASGQTFVLTDQTKPYVLYNCITESFTEVPYETTPWPPHTTFYRKAGHYGDIVIHRFG
jgi:hypothetical protein